MTAAYTVIVFCCAWPQNLQPTTRSFSITTTNTPYIQVPAQYSPVPALNYT